MYQSYSMQGLVLILHIFAKHEISMNISFLEKITYYPHSVLCHCKLMCDILSVSISPAKGRDGSACLLDHTVFHPRIYICLNNNAVQFNSIQFLFINVLSQQPSVQ